MEPKSRRNFHFRPNDNIDIEVVDSETGEKHSFSGKFIREEGVDHYMVELEEDGEEIIVERRMVKPSRSPELIKYAKELKNNIKESGLHVKSKPVRKEDDTTRNEPRPAVNNTEEFAKKLDLVLREIKTQLIEKNRKYGSFYMDPKIKTDPVITGKLALECRISEKLTRLVNLLSLGEQDTEDTLFDIVGLYLIKKILERE